MSKYKEDKELRIEPRDGMAWVSQQADKDCKRFGLEPITVKSVDVDTGEETVRKSW